MKIYTLALLMILGPQAHAQVAFAPSYATVFHFSDGIGKPQITLDRVQATYMGNSWVRPCGSENHDYTCLDSTLLRTEWLPNPFNEGSIQFSMNPPQTLGQGILINPDISPPFAAACDSSDDGTVKNCKIIEGHTLDEVVNLLLKSADRQHEADLEDQKNAIAGWKNAINIADRCVTSMRRFANDLTPKPQHKTAAH